LLHFPLFVAGFLIISCYISQFLLLYSAVFIAEDMGTPTWGFSQSWGFFTPKMVNLLENALKTFFLSQKC